MRFQFCLAGAVVLGWLMPVRAGITVSRSDTIAQTNAYAPLDKSAYYAIDKKSFTSPATADVSQDWSGTNVGGLTNTWRMITSAHLATTALITQTSMMVSGSGAFNGDISTTEDFVDPTSVATLFAPKSAAGYNGFFTIDAPANYTLSGILGRDGGVSFTSIQNGVIYQKTYVGGLTFNVDQSGVIPPGDYQITASVGLGFSNFFPGINHEAESGSFDNFSFILQVPEPQHFFLAIFVFLRFGRQSKGGRHCYSPTCSAPRPTTIG
jgi:hypothetical protein